MYATERHQLILERARSTGRVDVSSLAEDFQVTAETIRRDLTVLERHGVMRRVHGGAIPVERLGFEPGLQTRDTVLVSEKERIAKAALAELPTEGAILLDGGSTTARLADALPHDRELTVLTNGLPIAMALSTRRNVTVMMLGGRVRGRTMAAVDAWALAALRDTYVDVAFLGANGVSVQRGLTTPDTTEAAVKAAMVSAARRTVALVDHSKIGRTHLSRFADLSDIDVVVTDSGVDPHDVDDLRAHGPSVVVA